MEKCEGFPIGTSILSKPRTGDCCDRVVRYVTPFGCTFGIAALISRSGSFVAISQTLPRLGAAEAASCEGVVTECEVRDSLKQVRFKSSGLDGLHYVVYLRMTHMFVPILTDMFNHWFAQGATPGSVTKGVITLLRKGGRHVWEGLDDYRPITLLNTELKILARVLANRLQLVISDLIGPEQTFAVKGRSIQDNLHLIREVLEGIKDDTEAALISLDQSKAFDRVDHRYLATVLETAGFELEFRRWISMMYHNPQAVVQVNGGRSRSNIRSGRAALCLLFFMSSRWSPSCTGLGIRGQVRHCAGLSSTSGLQEPREILTKGKVCGSVLGRVVILF